MKKTIPVRRKWCGKTPYFEPCTPKYRSDLWWINRCLSTFLFVWPCREVNEIYKHCISLLFSNKKAGRKKYGQERKIYAPQNIGFFKGTQIPKLCHLPYFAFIYNIINMYFYFIILAFVCSHKNQTSNFWNIRNPIFWGARLKFHMILFLDSNAWLGDCIMLINRF